MSFPETLVTRAELLELAEVGVVIGEKAVDSSLNDEQAQYECGVDAPIGSSLAI